MKVVFVCHGNICRSPMAEFIMKALIRKAGCEKAITVDSVAATTEEIGNDMYPPAKRMLTKKGIPESVSEHALEDIDDEFDLAYEVALKKTRSTANLPHDTRLRRTLGMLARRGFPQSVCMAAARRALEDA